MSSQGKLIAYAAAVVTSTLVHDPAWLAAFLIAALAAAGHGRWRLLRRALMSLLAFNLTVSLGYAGLALWRGDFRGDYLIVSNLRVLLLVFLGFWCVARVNLLSALRPFPALSLIATLAIGQIRTLERMLADFRLAFASRNPAPPRSIDRVRHAAAQGQALFDKSMAQSTEVMMAMRSRGAFDE